MKKSIISLFVLLSLILSFVSYADTPSEEIGLQSLTVGGKAVGGFYTGTLETDFWYGLDELPQTSAGLPAIVAIPTFGTASYSFEKIYKGFEARISLTSGAVSKTVTLHFREFSEVTRTVASPSFYYEARSTRLQRDYCCEFTGGFKYFYLKSGTDMYSGTDNRMAYVTYDVPAVTGYAPVSYDMKGIRFYDCYTCSSTGDFHGISVYGYDGDLSDFTPVDVYKASGSETGNNDGSLDYISGYMINNFKGWNSDLSFLIANAPAKRNYAENETAYTSSFIREGQNMIIFKSDNTEQHLERMIYDSNHKMPVTVRYVEKYPVNPYSSNADISSVTVNGEAVPGVSADKLEYYVGVDDVSVIPSVSAVAASSQASVSITREPGEQTVNIDITAADGTLKRYRIFYRELLSEKVFPISKFRVYSGYSDDYADKDYFELSSSAQGYIAYKLSASDVELISASVDRTQARYNCPAEITLSDSVKDFSTIYDSVNDTFIKSNLKGLTLSSITADNTLAVNSITDTGSGPFGIDETYLDVGNITLNDGKIIVVASRTSPADDKRTYYYPTALNVSYVVKTDPLSNSDLRVEYKNNKNILVYCKVSGDPSEYGIIMNTDENEPDPTIADSVKFRAEKKNAAGRFAVELTDKTVVNDPVFNLRVYWIENGQPHYSDSVVTVNKTEYYGRIPLLNSVSLSAGELYPAFSEDVFDYYVLFDEIPEAPPVISYVKQNITDIDEYSAPGNVSGKAKIKLSSGFSDSRYTFSFRLKKSTGLPANKLLVKTTGEYSGDVSVISGADTFSLAPSQTAYIDFNKTSLPEKYIPVSVSVFGTGNTEVYNCTEPWWSSKPSGSYSYNYTPQYEEITRNGNYLDETKFKTKSALTIALKTDENVTLSSDISLSVEYFEDIPLPVRANDPSSANLSSLTVDGANEIYPLFDKNITEYYAVYDKLPQSIPSVNCLTEGTSASAQTSTDGENIYITVTSGDGNSVKEYTVYLRDYKTASLKLNSLSAKRQNYALFNIAIPVNNDNYVPSPYVGRVDNKSGTNWSHITAMAFNTSAVSESNIKISSAELNISAATNCPAGITVDLYRAVNTSWVNSSEGKKYYAVTNNLVLKGDEGVLNDKTTIKYVSNYYKNSSSYRYYTIPLKTEGFTDASSINLLYIPEYQLQNSNIAPQYAYLWLGRYGAEVQNGLGILPTVDIKYFVLN